MKLHLFLVILAIPGIIGCGGDGLPSVRYGQDGCAHCRMIISDDRFAAAAIIKSGELLTFDDICCLVDYLAAEPDQATHKWIRGYQSGQWHDVDRVFFVFGPKLQTPMASGLAAVNSKEEADALARKWGGKLLRFAELSEFLKARRLAFSQGETGSVEEPISSKEELR